MIAFWASPFKHVTVMARIAMTHVLRPTLINDYVILYHLIARGNARVRLKATRVR